MKTYRSLTQEEIQQLKERSCTAVDWDEIEVVENFKTDYIYPVSYTHLGPGETQLEMDRRIILNRMSLLKERLAEIDKQKSTQRKNRGRMIDVYKRQT